MARIGQGPNNDIVLDDDTVSTSQARIEFADGGWHITDLDSKNGTYLGGTRLPPRVATPLENDAVVGFGMVRLSFHVLEAPTESLADPAGTGRDGERSEVRRAGFRLPVWLVALVIVLVIALALLVLWLGGDPDTVTTFLHLIDDVVLDGTSNHLIPAAA